MLTNANHQASDQRPTDSSDTTQHPTAATPRCLTGTRPAQLSALPSGCPPELQTTDSLINTTQSWDSTSRPFMVLKQPHPRSDSELPIYSSVVQDYRQPQRGHKPRPARRLYSTAVVKMVDFSHRPFAQPLTRLRRRRRRRINTVYPETRTQKLAIATWLTASRWTYNLTAWRSCSQAFQPYGNTSPAWWCRKSNSLHPEWDSVPYQVKRTAVRDACRAMSNVKIFNLELKASQTHGTTKTAPNSATAAARTPGSPATILSDAVTEPRP